VWGVLAGRENWESFGEGRRSVSSYFEPGFKIFTLGPIKSSGTPHEKPYTRDGKGGADAVIQFKKWGGTGTVGKKPVGL